MIAGAGVWMPGRGNHQSDIGHQEMPNQADSSPFIFVASSKSFLHQGRAAAMWPRPRSPIFAGDAGSPKPWGHSISIVTRSRNAKGVKRIENRRHAPGGRQSRVQQE